jgi:phosphomannomutase
MIKEQAIFGCETSGHYYFKENFYLDNGLMPFLAVLEILSNPSQPPLLQRGGDLSSPSFQKRGLEGVRKTFSEILKPLREKFYISEEINFQFTNQNILEDIRQKYQDAQIGDIDGYDFNYPNWRFNVRKSNTENLLRLNVEADSSELLKQKIDEVLSLINQLK